MTLNLKIAEEEDSELWDELVEGSPHGTIFHNWKFLKIMEKHTRKRMMGTRSRGILYPLLVLKGSTPIGIIPLFYYENFFIKSILSPPLGVECLYLGPLLKEYGTMKQSKKEVVLVQFQKALDEFINTKFKPHIISLHLSPGILDSRPFKWTGYKVELRHTYVVDLAGGVDYVWKQFSKTLRGNINKSLDLGISVEEGSTEELEFIYNSLKKRRMEQGMNPTTSINYLTSVYQQFKNNLKILIAKHNGKPVGGLINLYYKDKVLFWVGAPKISGGINSNEILLWESIKLAYKNGFTYYELMGANHPSLYKFKTKFNGNLITSLSCKKYPQASIRVLEVLYRAIESR